MDKTKSSQKDGLFLFEVRQWLSELALTNEQITVSEPEAGHFWLESRSKAPLLLLTKPLFAPIPFDIKSFLTNQENIRTIILWEDIWHTKKEIVQSRLMALLGISHRIPGRVTTVRKIDRPTTLRFLEENHVQAPVLSKYKYGLYLPRRYYRVLDDPQLIAHSKKEAEELLVAVATFAHPRTFTRKGRPHRSFELVRFANLKNTTVVGGLDKLLTQFIRDHRPDDIMTYVDLEWSTGAGYQKLGFVPHEDTPPLDFWVNALSYERFYPHRLPNGVNEENAPDSGFIKIKNAGSRKFVKTL